MAMNSNTSNRIKAPTLKDVAREANVSIATASHVVNDKGSVSVIVRKRVLKIIKQLGYQPNKAARSMKTGKSMTIGLILPDFRYPFFPALAREIEIAAAKSNYAVIFVNSYADSKTETKCFNRMMQLGVDGIIWFPGSQQDIVPESAANMPIAVIDRDLPNYDIAMPNHYQGGKIQAEHLLTLGHEQIGIVSGPLKSDNMTLRVQGAREAIEKAGHQLFWVCETEFNELSQDAINHIIEKQPSAIIAGDDIIAINIYKQLEELGIKTGEDISIVGFDNIPWTDIIKPSLTTVDIPLQELASDAIDLLLARISDPALPRKKRIVDVTLKLRSSTCQCS